MMLEKVFEGFNSTNNFDGVDMFNVYKSNGEDATMEFLKVCLTYYCLIY